MRREFTIRLRDGHVLTLGPTTLVAGVLNVTPDSFSDGGLNSDSGGALERALGMESKGAGLIEVGGESTRPGASTVCAEDELARVLPVLRLLSSRLRVPVAVDTYKSKVAAAALDCGAAIINDVSALRFDPVIAEVAARERATLVLMHMRGTPATMQELEPSPDIFAEIEADLSAALAKALTAGVEHDHIIADPGIGFGKTLEQNLAIINELDRFEVLGLPLMIGTSRKSFIGRITGRPANERLLGTAASVAVSIVRGAHIVRVHDVREMVEVARVTDAILSGEPDWSGHGVIRS